MCPGAAACLVLNLDFQLASFTSELRKKILRD